MAATPEVDTVYAPGACNIGRDEIAVRRKLGYIGVAIAAALAALLFVVSASPWVFLLVALPVFLAAIGFVQAKEGFCVRYAAQGVYNVGGGLRPESKVSDEIAHRADMKKALSLNLRAGAIALGTAGALAAIAALVS